MSDLSLDHTRDISGRETHRLTSLYPPPDFVKNASHERVHGDPETLPRHMFADPANKLYPCHSAPATWMSALFFEEKKGSLAEDHRAAVQAKIDQHASYFGISGLVTELRQKVAANVGKDLAQLPDEDFAIVWADGAGNKERHWPLRNATEVKYAAAHFKKHRDEFAFEDRHKIAVKILDKALEYGADTSPAEDTLELAAGRGACAAKVAAEMLRNRASLVRRTHAELSAEMTKLASLVEANELEARREETRLKIASIVDQFDRDTNLCKLYDAGGLPRAEEVLFAITEKVANDFLKAHVETTTGNVYNLDDLEKLAVEDVRNWLGDEFADAVSAGGVYMDRDKLAAIVPTLDRGMAGTLDRLLQEKGFDAAVKSAATSSSLLPLERLYELANG
jgi:hypothetical protein